MKKDKNKEVDYTKKANRIKNDIRKLMPDIPNEVLNKVDKQVEMQMSQKRISPSTLTKELFDIKPKLRTKLRLSILFACIGEICAFASYFFAAYAASWVTKYFTDGRIPFDQLLKYSMIALGLLIAYLILTGVSTAISHKTAFEILKELKIHLFDKLKEIPLGYMVENSVGKIKVLINERVLELEDWIAHIMPEITSKIIHPILCTVILFVLDWRLGLSILGPVPLFLVGMAIMMRKYEARFMLWTSSYSDVSEKTAEYVRGIPVIKAFLQDDKSYKQFSESVNFYHDSTISWWKQSWLGMGLGMAAILSPIIVTLPLATYLYNIDEITITTFILSIILPLSILPQAYSLAQSMELYMVASNVWLSIRDLLFMEPQSRPSSDIKPNFDNSQGVEFKDVSFSYKNGNLVLKNINFKADMDKVTAIVGPSGSGKSTIAKLISSYWDVNSGDILIEGVSIKDIPFNSLMEKISYVSQENYLFDTSIKENIKIGKPEATDEEVIEAAKAANCHDFISSLPNGYDTSAGDAGNLLSGGEKQRIAIARCILKPSDIIVLDEATAYTDPENESLIQEAISKLVKDKTLIVIAHRLHTIENADKIIVIDKGEVSGYGTHKELIEENKLYQNLSKKYNKEV